ncbi:LytR/AlgR family response regulator transcription factor [Olsenella sp. An188]|uniref:LytR/AlgR family response regulator transcription factor n=1 Tax=Olsenella sp. An188 TaxID=1965579 RepID=UPI000B37035F|nr:LytTR family DNA-binding domain-containing protein [Olsenella sp. An188]OUP39131.1 hypothetical protein B5F23_03150 [Olsenella sp. An188]
MLVAVVDDTEADAASLASYIEEFSRERGVALQVERFSHPGSFFKGDTSRFSLVILDIDMPGMNGVEAARLLRETDPDVVIMFVTNYPQYALAGYEVEAVDYVIKPISYGEFFLKMQKALRYVGRNTERSVVIKTKEGVVSLSVWELLYVESSRHYLIYHTAGETYRERGSMSSAEKNLAPLQFARCNSGYLVNLRHVKGIDGEDVIVGGERLKISRGRRAEFLAAFSRFVGGI